MKKLVLENISMSYKNSSKSTIDFELNIENLTINQGELFTLIGESGCGKTSILRIIAGLEDASFGKVLLDDVDITSVQPEKRGIGMVFQKPLLFPHMSIFENLEFALKIKKISSNDIKKMIKEILIEMDLKGFESKYPRELSGGESQRVSLARSLLLEPKVLLMDEPFSALDVNTRLEMQKLVKRLHTSRHMTIVFVTHDLEEAFSLSDKVAIVNNGSIDQVDSPYELYTNPRSEFVANFVGVTNVYTKSDLELLLEKNNRDEILKKINFEDKYAKIGIRAKSILLDEHGSIKNAKLVFSKFKGDICTLYFEKSGVEIVVDSKNNNHHKYEIGETVNLEFDYSEIVYIKGD